MSKDIWHITNQNGNPTDIPEKENFIILDGVLGNSGLWYGGEEPIIFWENVKCWCYLDELILENERTRKALDVAVDALEKIGSGNIIEHSVVGHENDNKIFIANKALDESKTALEQKE